MAWYLSLSQTAALLGFFFMVVQLSVAFTEVHRRVPEKENTQ